MVLCLQVSRGAAEKEKVNFGIKPGKALRFEN